MPALLLALALVACDRSGAPAEPTGRASLDAPPSVVAGPAKSPPLPPPASATARAALRAADTGAALSALDGHARALGIDASGAVTEPNGVADPESPPEDSSNRAPDDPAGYWQLAKALEASGRPRDAATAYRAVAERVPVLTDAAMLAAGGVLALAEEPEKAAEAFEAAGAAAHNAQSAILAAIGRGNALLATGSADDAGRAYREALALTQPPDGAGDAAGSPAAASAARHAPIRDDGARAQALAGMITTEAATGRVDEAFDLRRRLIRELPDAPPARVALTRLEEAGKAVDDVEAAAVLAAAGEHDAAMVRLEAALAAAEGAGHVPGDLVVRAMAVDRARGRVEEAVARADAFLAANEGDAAAPTVALRRAEALVDLERIDEALAAWSALAERWPTDGVAAEALWLRARRLDRQGDGPRAAEAYRLLAARFPDHARAMPSAFRAGFLCWRDGDPAAAEASWRAIAERRGAWPDERARASFWLGRLAADAGEEAAAAGWWHAAIQASPRDGYARRSADRLRAIGEEPAPTHAASGALEDWPDPGASAAWDTLSGQPLLERLRAWQSLGDESAARLTLERLRDQWAAGEPAALAAIAQLSADEGAPDLAIRAARAAMSYRPEAVPPALARLAYPIGFDAEVTTAAARHALSPALLRALIWQESRWRADVVSHAGAIGLTQVMPDTGRFIAGHLGETAFDPSWLTSADVAVRYGTWYLAEQRQAFDARDAVALAAYNGGPGNARIWWDAARGDEDAFLEVIGYDETRAYVRAVLGAEAVYEALYP